jgi:hypothetical protein
MKMQNVLPAASCDENLNPYGSYAEYGSAGDCHAAKMTSWDAPHPGYGLYALGVDRIGIPGF